MRYSFHPEAKEELREAAHFYESNKKDLGFRFTEEVENTVQKILKNPLLPRTTTICDVRKWRVRVFPYGVYYRIKDDVVQIIAVMHLHRRPFYWIGRMHE